MEMVFKFTLAPPPPAPVMSFPLHQSTTIRYCKLFSIWSVLLSVQLCPSLPSSLFPPNNLPPVGFDKHVVLQMRGARCFVRRHSLTHTHTSTNMTEHMQSCVCKMKTFKLAKCLDWAHFYIYVPVYFYHTLALGGIRWCSCALLPSTKGKSAAPSFNKNNVP